MEDHFVEFIHKLSTHLVQKPVQKIVLDPMTFEKLKGEFYQKYNISQDDQFGRVNNAFRLLGVTIEKGRM
jgi:hypothetical protein